MSAVTTAAAFRCVVAEGNALDAESRVDGELGDAART